MEQRNYRHHTGEQPNPPHTEDELEDFDDTVLDEIQFQLWDEKQAREEYESDAEPVWLFST